MKRLLTLLLGVLVLTIGCRRSSPSGAGEGAAGTGGGSAVAAALPPELLNIIQKCPPHPSLEVYNCDHEAWHKSAFVRGPGGDEQRIELLTDARPLVRSLVAKTLDKRPCPSDEMCAYAGNRKLSERLLGIAEAELDERVALELARPIARIDVKKTELNERVEKYIETAPEKVSARILSIWLQFNSGVLPSLIRFADSAKPSLRKEALNGMRHAFGGSQQAEVCSVYVAKFGEGPEYDAVATTILHGERGNTCLTHWDAFLAKAEQRRVEGFQGLGPAPNWYYDLFRTAREAALTEDQKRATLEFAVRASEDTALDAKQRVSAIFFAAPSHSDPDAYLEPLTRDANAEVRKNASEWKESEGQRLNRTPFAGFRGPTVSPGEPSPASAASAPDAAETQAEVPRATKGAERNAGGPESAEQLRRPRPRRWKLTLAVTLAASLALLVAISSFFALRRTPQPVTSALPEPDPAPLPRNDSPTTSKRSRPPCAVHGLATAPDGRCVLCRSVRAPAPATTALLSSRSAKHVALAGSVAFVLVVGWLVALIPRAGSGSRSSPSVQGFDVTSASDELDASTRASGKLEYVSDVKRSQARNSGATYVGGGMAMISSPQFRAGGTIPLKYTCDGANVSPPLVFSNVPINAKSLSLELKTSEIRHERPRGAPVIPPGQDHQAHWVLHNLPPNLAGLPEGVTELPPGVIAPPGPNGKAGYFGPCPDGDEVSYEFWLYAWDTVVPDPGPGKRVELSLKDHALAVEIENGRARYWARLKARIPDLPDELRHKWLGYRVCDARGSQCRLSRTNARDGVYSGSLSFRNDQVGLWFMDEDDHESNAAIRFDVNLARDGCKREGKDFDCSFSYSELRSTPGAGPSLAPDF